MSNDPQADLIYAILAMDSYNRGYGAGINNLSDSVGTRIGNFTVSQNAADAEGVAFSSGFYAIAYQYGNEVVISYRGTDNKGVMDSAQLGGSDPLYGYGIALGWTGNTDTAPDLNETQLTTQSRLAADFYHAIDATLESEQALTLTGHSLGGGLAGFVSTILGVDAVNGNCREGIAA